MAAAKTTTNKTKTKKTVEGTALAKLEGAVDRLLAEFNTARSGAAALSAVESASGDPADSRSLALRVQALEGENQDLRERLSHGQSIAERLVAKIRFLEEKK